MQSPIRQRAFSLLQRRGLGVGANNKSRGPRTSPLAILIPKRHRIETIVGQALVLGVEAIDHFGDRIEAVKVNEIPKHLSAGMRSALATDVYDRKCLFKRFI